MSIVVLLIFSLLFVNIKIHPKGNEDYLNQNQTKAINGFFILLVFLRHFEQYVTFDSDLDVLFLMVNSAMGQLIVTSFMFFSGYGVMYSITKKGEKYIKSMPKNRILRTLLLFDTAILFYVVLNLILGIEMNIKDVILSFIGLESIGNSSWYIFAILVMYVITWFSFFIGSAVKKKKTLVGLILSSVLILGYIFVVRYFKPSQYYNTVLCYAFGLWFSYFKEYIDKLLKKKSLYITAVVFTAIIFIAAYMLQEKNILFALTRYIVFIGLLVLLSMKIKIGNPILNYCGNHILSLYILQRLPMIALSNIEFMQSYPYIFLLIAAVATVALSWIFDKTIAKAINNLFMRKKIQVQNK